MAKVLVEALENFPYDYADRKIGDQFECDEVHARVFNAHGKTKSVVVDRNLHNVRLETTQQKAEDEEQPIDTSENRRNRKYKRRDMRPEE